MCLIVFDNRRNSQDRIEKSILKRVMEKNSEGMGIMYPRNGKLITWSTMDGFKSIWSRYCAARNDSLPVAIHFRKNTKGANILDNCHPFVTHEGLAFMHNGTIFGVTDDTTGDKSDSRVFCETLSTLPSDFLMDPVIYSMVRQFISGDRMLFMDRAGNFSIMNETSGKWEWESGDKSRDGVWFSHTRDHKYFLTGEVEKKGGVVVYNDKRSASRPVGYYNSNEWAPTTKRVYHPEDRVRNYMSPSSLEKEDRLLFVYGSLRDDIAALRPDGPFIDEWDASYVGLGEAKGLQLWALEDPNLPEGRPGALRLKDTKKESSVHGYVLGLRGSTYSAESALKAIDKEMEVGVKYYRTKVTVNLTRTLTTNVTEHSTHEVWAYLAAPIDTVNPLMALVSDGDWGEWVDALKEEADANEEEAAEIDEDDLDWLYSAKDDNGNISCLMCNSDDVVPFVGTGLYIEEITSDDRVEMYWCSTCNDQYHVEMTGAQIQEYIDNAN